MGKPRKPRNNKNKDYKSDKKGKDFDLRDEKPCGKSDNDPRWYATDPNLVADFAKLSFSNPVGYVNNIRPETGIENYIDYDMGMCGDYITPGLMTLELVPTIGVAMDNDAPVNKGAMDLITQIRSKLGSFTKIYDAPDVMKYILAVDSAQTFYYFMCRLYGLMNLYYVDNYYYPKTLITANNVNFESITGRNANALKGYIDKYANYVSKFPIPATLSLLARHAWLYQSLYTDSDALKPQLYMFVPGQFLEFTEIDTDGNVLLFKDFGPSYHDEWDLDGLIAFGNSLLNAIQTSQDLQYIAGDIRKAFGDDMLVPIYQIDENYVVPQTHSYEILSQIENSTAVGKNLTTSIRENYDTVDPSRAMSLYYHTPAYRGATGFANLASHMITVSDAPVVTGKKILNFHTKEAPSGDDVMVATRLTALSQKGVYVPEPGDDGMNYCAPIVSGSEFVTAYRIYYRWPDGEGGYNTNNQALYTNCGNKSVYAMQYLSMFWTAFDWAPELRWLYDKTADPTTKVIGGIMLDVANYTVLSLERYKSLHDIALMSEFGITQTTENKTNFSTEKYSARK